MADLGFRLADRRATGGQSFRDGWRLVYSAPTLTVTVQYLDMQFEVLFARAGIDVDYLFIDRELFGRRSGLHGNMFPSQNVGEVIGRVASDIREHFSSILLGDDNEWARIKRLLEAPKAKARLP